MTPVSAADIRQFILAQLQEPLDQAGFAGQELPDDFDLQDNGIIDSFGLIELISAVEEEFQLEIDFEPLDPEELTVLGPLTRFIESQSASATQR
jgi:acyl carrier protein